MHNGLLGEQRVNEYYSHSLFLALLLSLGSEEQAIVCRNLLKKIYMNLVEKKKRKNNSEFLVGLYFT